MNNDLRINMRIASSDSINMKLEDNKPIDANIQGGVKEVDPIFRNSPAYTITYNDINVWNHKSDFSGNYNDLTNKPTIPTSTSQLINDSGFIDKNVNNLANYTLSTNISEVGLTGNYSDLIDTPTIPTATSDLENDSGFITNSVDDLTNYTLSSSLATVATTGDYDDLTNTPSLATVATTGNYIDLLNKPTLSTVASTGDYDDLIDKPTIPTKTSDLTNDSGFITNANIPTKTSDLTNDSGFITNTVNDLTNYTLSSSLATVATSGSYSDLSNTPTIPTNTSDLNNDSGFITNTVNDLTNYTLSSNLASVATSGSYSDLSNTPTIPTATSDLNNDSGFITNTVNDLTNYTLSSSLSTVATSGSYNDLSNKPTIPTAETLNVYSTSETAIGTWYDNKTIYRLVIVPSTPISATANTWTTITALSNVGEIINYFALLSYDIYGSYLCRMDNGNFQVYFKDTLSVKKVIVEYTKAS